jgi:N-acetylglucosaminyl-diphospho-decaprenol L-rhamnosyltransferase
MLISLVTVTHRSREKLRGYVDSFLQWHGRAEPGMQFEFIFVENSGDACIRQVVQPLADAGHVVTVRMTENLGFGNGCNDGAVLAKGELLVFVNPDLRFASSLAPLAVKVRDPNFWGTVAQLNGQHKMYAIDLLPEHKSWLFELLNGARWVNTWPALFAKKCYVVGSCLVMARSLYERAQGFNPNFFLYYEEAELARRLQAIAGTPSILHDIQVLHEGFGSHDVKERVFEHETDGFLTYCRVTNQPGLIGRRIRVLRVLSTVSSTCRLRLRLMLARQNNFNRA